MYLLRGFSPFVACKRENHYINRKLFFILTEPVRNIKVKHDLFNQNSSKSAVAIAHESFSRQEFNLKINHSGFYTQDCFFVKKKLFGEQTWQD
jgi:hypothetical protein